MCVGVPGILVRMSIGGDHIERLHMDTLLAVLGSSFGISTCSARG